MYFVHIPLTCGLKEAFDRCLLPFGGTDAKAVGEAMAKSRCPMRDT